jgi:GNAT superfamily N-acetyltransferase
MTNEGGAVAVRAATAADRPTVARVLTERWGTTTMVSRGARHDAATAPAFVAERGGRLMGLATYLVAGGGHVVELLTLDALEEGQGVGSGLVEAVVAAAAAAGCARVVLVTPNDNTAALRFYQRRGFRLVALHAGAVDVARKGKPEIPLTGNDGIPIHDELELALDLLVDDGLASAAGRTRWAADPVQ